MHQHQLVILIAQAQHAESECQQEGAGCDEGLVAEFVEQGASEAGEGEGEEDLEGGYPGDLGSVISECASARVRKAHEQAREVE